MIAKIISSAVVALVLGAGVAYAATQLASSDGTDVCVNQTNGLMRASSTCREGEYAMTIGGGGNVVVTQNGMFTVVVGESVVSKTLPLTGITVTASCVSGGSGFPPDMVRAYVRFDAADGQTMDVPSPGTFGPSGGIFGAASFVPGFLTYAYPTWSGSNDHEWLMTSNGATAEIRVDAAASGTPQQKCMFLWQATEAAN